MAARLLLQRRILLLTLAVCLGQLAGCALDRLPRIDPTGERILLFPDDPQPVIPGQVAVPGTPAAPVDPFTGVPVITPPPGNPTAPPALSNNSPGLLRGLFQQPTIVGPVVGTPVVGQPIPVPPQDRVVLTPERVLAPIGSEVVLKAGVCESSGYLQANRRIEWQLGQQGVGQFVSLGDQGETDVLRWPWQRPNKIDNNFAIGYTTPFYTCLKRNLADPADDLQIQPGDAWISVTSAAEGTSYVTAYAPSVEDWSARKQSTVIYWIDAQWTLPPSTTVPAGQPHTLTTTVTRQSDGAPIAGWIVRYEVNDSSGARLGYEAGQATEVATNSQGQASIEVSPTDAGTGSSTVNVTIIRPDVPGSAGGPRINVGSGQATITWAADAVAPPSGLPPIAEPAPTQPPTFEPPINQPPVAPAPAGRPELEVRLQRDTSDPIQVGDSVSYSILVRNNGTAAARNIRITDRFDRGLSNSLDTRGRNEIVYDGMSDLAPGESDQIRVDFDVLEAGERRHEVIVTADDATEAYDRASFTAQPIRQDPPNLRVEMVARPRYIVGDVTDPSDIRGVVENTGSTVATNVVVRMRYETTITALSIEQAREGETVSELADGYQWVIAQLQPGQSRTFRLQCQVERPANRSCVRMFVSADGGVEKADEACFEILPRIGDSPAEGGGSPGPGPESGLQLSIASVANPARAGRSSTLQLFLVNNGSTPQRQVVVELLLPDQIRPNLQATQSPTAGQIVEGGVIRFAPIAELPGGGRESILIPYDAVSQGRFNLQARVLSNGSPQGTPAQVSLEVLPR
ncbi:MAG: hypothetical protein AAGF31_07315 [Planctomycetota bacterium]